MGYRVLGYEVKNNSKRPGCCQRVSRLAIYSISTIDNEQRKVRCLFRRNRFKQGYKIGSHSVVMPGVTVGENSILGAFSFVDANVPDNVVAVGVPARVIKSINK